nr:hypothetical protein 29 [Burkholderiaceae bacterium]
MEEIVEELTKEEQQELDDRLQIFGSTLSKQRDEWVRSRRSTGVDKRWTEDEAQYNSKDNRARMASDMMQSAHEGFPVLKGETKPHRSTVYIGLTRNKTNAAEARVADILLPTDDRNWGIDPTPDPKLMSMSNSMIDAKDEQGKPMLDELTKQPMKHRDVARKIMEEAKVKAKAMQTIITDQLVECDYLSELRKVIHDGAVLGTGVVKGPIVTNNVRQAWQPYTDGFGQTVHNFVFVEELNPASYRVDPRNIWPDPACGENIHDGKGIFERHLMTPKQVRELRKQPGYIKEQLRKVLEEGPKYTPTIESMRDEEDRDYAKQTYEMWEYWGEIDYEDLKASGVEFDEDEDILESYSACVVMINNTVIKVFLNPLDSGELPYDFYCWEKNSGSCWGFGIPYLMRSQQKILNAAYRQLMDNAGISSGPQIVVKPSVISPADKQWQLSSRKIWFATDDTDDVRKAFTSFEFNSHQAELTGIIKLANELADQETGVPMMLQGSQGGVTPDTVGGMQMLLNNTNVVLRRLVKQFDDMVTKPHIRRYYNYNMAYNDNEDIKGDFAVLARGSSALLVRDVQNQSILNLLAAGANPVYGMFLDTQKLFERALQAQHIDPKEVFKSEAEIEQIKQNMKLKAQQGQPPDPRVQAAQIRAQTDMMKVQAQNQGDMQELQQRAEIQQSNAQLKMQELAMEREIEMLKMANNNNLTLEQIKAKLAETAMRERGKKELFTAEQNLKLKTGSGI